MANNWKQAWPIVYDRKMAEAYLTLKGYVPVERPDNFEDFKYIGIKSTDPALRHLCAGKEGMTWYAGLGPGWVECGWEKFGDANLHNTFMKWKSKYEPEPRRDYEP